MWKQIKRNFTSLTEVITHSVLYSQDPCQKCCMNHKIDCWAKEKKKTTPCGYNNHSLSTDTQTVAVIFRSAKWGNTDICKSTEGIRQGFLPPAVHGPSPAENTGSSVEVR